MFTDGKTVTGRRPRTATAQPQTVPNPASVPWVTCLLLKCLYFPVYHENVVPIADHSPAQPLTGPSVLVEATAPDATAWGLSQPGGCKSKVRGPTDQVCCAPLPASSAVSPMCSPGGRDRSSLGSTLLPSHLPMPHLLTVTGGQGFTEKRGGHSTLTPAMTALPPSAPHTPLPVFYPNFTRSQDFA